jgi:hypothetical protein
MCLTVDSAWIQSSIENFLFPFLVAVLGYILIVKLDEWRKRKSYSRLGAVIIESLIEEVNTGITSLRTTRDVSNGTVQKPNNYSIARLPRKSWNGMTTIPDEVLLRIIEVTKGVTPIHFPPREIRIHCKNYFDHMAPNWDQVVSNPTKSKEAIIHYIEEGQYIQASEGVLNMLEQTRDLLEKNSARWFPK